jgi:glutaredoxin 3
MVDRQVKIFSTPTCPWCKRAKSFLESNGVKFQEYNVVEDKAAREVMINTTHQITVPTILIDSEVIIGYNEKALKEKLGLVSN